MASILNLWSFYFLWTLLGLPVVSALMTAAGTSASALLTQVALLMANMSTFFMIFLMIQALFGMPLSLLSRAPSILTEELKRRAGKLAPNETRPEPLAYDKVPAQLPCSPAPPGSYLPLLQAARVARG